MRDPLPFPIAGQDQRSDRQPAAPAATDQSAGAASANTPTDDGPPHSRLTSPDEPQDQNLASTPSEQRRDEPSSLVDTQAVEGYTLLSPQADRPARERIMAIVRSLDTGATYDDILRELAFERMVRRGLDDLADGRMFDTESVLQEVRSWQS